MSEKLSGFEKMRLAEAMKASRNMTAIMLGDGREPEHHTLGWRTYESPIGSYDWTFRALLDGETIAVLVARRARELGRRVRVIDLLSSTAALSSLAEGMGEGRMSGVAVGLTDPRNAITKELDEGLNIELVVGDLTRSSVRNRLVRKGAPADLIVERAVGGHGQMPNDRNAYRFFLDGAWNMLAEDGILLLQTPSADTLQQWGMPTLPEIAKRMQDEGLEVCSSLPPIDDWQSRPVIRIQAGPAAPRTLSQFTR